MQDFQGKVVVVTGAATGIGQALARQFHLAGARLVLAGRRLDRLQEEAAALATEAQPVQVFPCDVTDRGQVEALAEFALRSCGQIDVLVNNAGLGPIPSSVIDAKREDVQKVLDTNLFGVWNGVSVFGRHFIESKRPAAIYNVGSENCFFNAVPLAAGYIASKHALLAMTLALREEVPAHIRIGLICPGLVRSELAPETSHGMDTDAFAVQVMRQIREGAFYIVSHAYNAVRIEERQQEITAAYARHAPRQAGDEAFDVRSLGARLGWYPPLPLEAGA